MGVIEDRLKERAERDYTLLSSVGLDTGATWFPPGTEAVAGRNAIKRARADFAELPPAEDALAMLSNTVEAEEREDIPSTFGMDGKLRPALNGGLALDDLTRGLVYLLPNERSIQQLGLSKPPGHPAAVADINSWLPQTPTKNVVCRTRLLNEERIIPNHQAKRELYAAVSPDYIPYDIDKVADDLMEIVPAESRARVRYDGARARIDIVLQNPYRLDGEDKAAVGETHRVVLRVKTTDDGTGGYHIAMLAERVRCINLSLLHAKKYLLKATHRTDNLRNLAQVALGQADSLMKQFATVWADSWQEYYADKHTKGNIDGKEAITRIVRSSKFRITGLGEEGTLNACLAALAQEPGDTKAHVHNALTRASHDSSVGWQSRWADDDAEEAASNLLYQHVNWLPEVEA